MTGTIELVPPAIEHERAFELRRRAASYQDLADVLLMSAEWSDKSDRELRANRALFAARECMDQADRIDSGRVAGSPLIVGLRELLALPSPGPWCEACMGEQADAHNG